MVAATYTSDLADIFLFESTTGVAAWNITGGGGASLGAGADYAVEGTNAVDKQVSASEKGFMYQAGAAWTIGADDHHFIWLVVGTSGIANTRDNRGICVCIGDDTSNYVQYHVNGSDTLPLGGVVPYAVRHNTSALTNFRSNTGTPSAAPDNIGVTANVTGTAKFANTAADACRIGTGYDILNGTGADPEADFAGIATDDVSTREGVFYSTQGGYLWQGKLRIGSAATACEFLDSNTNLFVVDTLSALADFTEFLVEHASSIVTLTNVNFISLSTADGIENPGRLEVLTDTATLTFDNVGFIDWGDTVLGSGSSLLNGRWIGSDVITANGATLNGSSISGYEGTGDSSALIWNTADDPDGLLDDMTISKGTAATHAIEFGLLSPLTMTINGMTANTYNASNAANDSTFNILRTTGTVTINVIGGTGNFSYKTAGATVLIVVDPVTLTVNTIEKDGTPIASARVHVFAADGTGPLPFEDSVTIARVTTVATVTHTAHGFSTGQKVLIEDAVQEEYNGVKTIVTVPTAGTYTFTVAGTPTTPATGTIIATGVVISGLSNGSGVITDSRTYSGNQPITGRARKSTIAPFFKPGAVNGIISSVNGLETNAVMTSDE